MSLLDTARKIDTSNLLRTHLPGCHRRFPLQALHFYTSSADIKLELHGSNDQDYAMTLLDKATALTKVGDGELAMDTFSQAIESGLPLDSWELGIAYKYMAKHFYENDDIGASFDSYTEAISIFEWIMENEQPASNKYDDVIECYVHLLDMNDQPISEERGLTCYKLANCYVEVSKLEGTCTHLSTVTLIVITSNNSLLRCNINV